jgi:hypothetical protein
VHHREQHGVEQRLGDRLRERQRAPERGDLGVVARGDRCEPCAQRGIAAGRAQQLVPRGVDRRATGGAQVETRRARRRATIAA